MVQYINVEGRCKRGYGAREKRECISREITVYLSDALRV
jgi:hypothetical protein